MPDWTREFYYYRVSLVDDRGKQTGVVPGGRFGKPPGLAWLGRCAGELAGTLRRQTGSGPRHTHGHMLYTCQTACQTHIKHMSYTCHTHGIHMEYTLFSAMLCHARSFSVMDVVGHLGCNSPGDCKFIVLHFYISPGVLPCVAKKQCSHHIPKITTVDIQPDGKYNFRKNSAVDKRQKSL